MMRFSNFLRLAVVAIGLSALALWIGKERVATAQQKWQTLSELPAPLLKQFSREINSGGALVKATPARMHFLKIQGKNQSMPLYLIDSRESVGKRENTLGEQLNSRTENPLCGLAGCAFFGYVQQGEQYVLVFEFYLKPNLPPQTQLFEVSSELSHGLPCLIVHQVQSTKLDQIKYCFNSSKYVITTVNNPD